MRRGEVWWASLPPPAGHRPVVLLSRDEAYDIRSHITVAPVSTRIRSIPTEVLLGPEEGLRRVCVANLDDLTTIPKSSLQERISALPPAKVRQIEAAIHFALGMKE